MLNGRYAIGTVIYLSKQRDRFVPRRELKHALQLEIPDDKLDRKMDALLRSDIIHVADRVLKMEYGQLVEP
ncbi:MAG: hypothetical protein GY801_00305 [bacterium]|nr:hypothetical protein [bacterium]